MARNEMFPHLAHSSIAKITSADSGVGFVFAGLLLAALVIGNLIAVVSAAEVSAAAAARR